MRRFANQRSVITILLIGVGIAALLCVSGFEGPGYERERDRQLSPGGKFRAIVGETAPDSLGGDFSGTFSGVIIEKIHPTWKDALTLNRATEVCALQSDGKLSIAWASPSQMIVTCWECKQDSFGDALNAWQGISIEYVNRGPRPDLKYAKR